MHSFPPSCVPVLYCDVLKFGPPQPPPAPPQWGADTFHGVVFWSDRLGSEPTGRGLEDFPGQAAIHWEAAPTLAR